MLKGDIINGYQILQDFSTAGGGLSKWSFAEKGGQVFFIKEFLSPKYPTDDAPGSPEVKARKRQECQKFEKHHQSLMQAVNEKCGMGGNLIFTIDFFRWKSKYYKVTEKIDVASLSTTEINELPLANRVVILKTVAHSLQILHKAGIVHGDLKPDNILIKQTKTGFYTTKLIDFDNSYFEGQPPELSEEVVGDAVFYSPELMAYVKGAQAPEALTTQSDVFALGLIYAIYLTGDFPDFSTKKYAYASTAVLEGRTLKLVDASLPNKLKQLIQAMLLPIPSERPTVQAIFDTLKNINLKEEALATFPREVKPTYVAEEDDQIEGEASPVSKLKGGLFKKVKKVEERYEEEEKTEKNTEKTSFLRGKGLRISKKDHKKP